MCVGTCSRIVGPCLLALGTLSVAANILLLFPGGASKYLAEGHISKHAKAMPGVWGGGIAVSTAVRTASFLPCLWSRGGASGSPSSPSRFFLPAGAAGSSPHHGGRVAMRRLLRLRHPSQCKAAPGPPCQSSPKRRVVGSGGWPHGGTWQGAASPMAPRWDMAWTPLSSSPMVGRDGWPLSRGGTWQGAASPVAPRWDAAWRQLPRGQGFLFVLACALPHRAPHGSSLPASAQLKTTQPSDGSVLSLSTLGLEPLGVEGRGVLPPYQTPPMRHSHVLEPA